MPLPLSWPVFLTALLLLAAASAFALQSLLRRLPSFSVPLLRVATAALLALGVGLTVWSTELRMAGNPLFAHAMLFTQPLAIQAGLGLALVLVAGAFTGLLVLHAFPSSRARAVLLLGGIALLFAQSALPIHLSAPDFDDLFTVDKFLGSTAPAWLNTKPDFCSYDFLYRVGDFFVSGVSADRLARFRINAWFWVLYLANVLVLLRTTLAALAVERLGKHLVLFAALLAVSWLGPLVLSHTLAYELAGSTLFLLAFNLIEALRRSPASSHVRAAAVALIAACALFLQSFNFDASSVCWGIVYVHALLVLRHLAAPLLERIAVVLALGAALWLILGRDPGRYVDPSDLKNPGQVIDYVMVLLPVAVVLVVTWRSVGGAAEMRTLFATLRGQMSEATALAVYFLGGLVIYVHANQAKFGILFPNRRRGFHWDYATNHARYGAFFFPFLFTAWAYALLRHPRLTPRTRFLALAFSWFAWNEPYVAEFYADPGETQGQHAPYRANDRTLAQAELLLAPRDPNETLGFLPIPRDHGDHFLLRAVRPQGAFSDLCRKPNDPAVQTVLFSWHTLDVLQESGVKTSIWRAGSPPLDMRRDVWLVPRAQFDPAWLNDWCLHFTRDGWMCL